MDKEKFCKYCVNRKGEKGTFCVIKDKYVPRKGTCDQHKEKK